MKISLSENMRRLRKQNGMTQEELAERINVSLGVVSKWERGASEPELASLVAIAEVFRVSVDSLIGYDMTGEKPEDVAERISELKKQIRIAEAIELANEALIKYPNNLEVVFKSAILFHITENAGFGDNYDRAIELFSKAITLLPQDTEGKYSEVEMNTYIALCLLEQHKYDEAIRLIKANNVSGMNEDLLGIVLVNNKHDYKEGMQHLAMGAIYMLEKITRLASGFVNAYGNTGNYEMAERCVDAFDKITEAVTLDPDRVNILGKINALMQAGAACYADSEGNTEKARKYTERAASLAIGFDAAPDYSVDNILFAGEIDSGATAFDDTGEITVNSVDKMIKEQGSKELYEIWKETVKKYESKNTDKGILKKEQS